MWDLKGLGKKFGFYPKAEGWRVSGREWHETVNVYKTPLGVVQWVQSFSCAR